MQHNTDVSQDEENTHSKTMCTGCHRHLFRCKTCDRPSQTALDRAARQADRASRIWVKHNQINSISECSSCHHFRQQCTRAWPVKPKRGRRSTRRDLEPTSPLLSQEENCHMETDVAFMSASTATPQKRATVTQTFPMPVSKSVQHSVDVSTSPLSKLQTHGIRDIPDLSAPLCKEERQYLTTLNRIVMSQPDD